MKLQLKKIKDINNIIKGTLYKIENPITITFEEKHEDGTNDIVHVNFKCCKGIYGIYGSEYKMPALESNGCSKVDIMCGLIDENSKKCYTYILDVKKNISGFNVYDDLKKLRAEAVKRIKDFIKQIDDSKTMKESLMVILRKDGFQEEGKVGIATREFNVDRFRTLSDRLYDFSKDNSFKINPLIAVKFQKEMLPIKKDAEIMKLFSEKKIKILDDIYDLEVYILDDIGSNNYTYEFDVQ
ncbi:hypothetical protein [Clostridium beijerinckii]|uniref:hypothetical protein n=1 Tax=Clostridium beijerinckii TaxID=1520 RepID=UPI00098CC387|nr:hypothetical protein [Clostridium beijerinckii]NRT79458.1 hypothetical protein [Clostridium beijerinckii]OOM41532.1 hypothetical protein CBEIJ_44620 [Clostridium beijerinckii]